MAKKPTGLSKKVSSIFSGMASLEQEVKNSDKKEAAQATPTSKEARLFAIGEQILSLITDVFSLRSRPRLIFDIGSSRVKAVYMVKEKDQWYIENALEHEFAPNEQGERLHTGTYMVNALQMLAYALDPDRQAQIGLVLSGSHAFFTITDPPEGPKETWRDTLIWQLADSAPFPLEEAEIAWTRLGSEVESANIKERLLVAAIKRPELDKTVNIFRQAGINLEILTPLPLAIESLMRHYRGSLSSGILVVDVGADHTQFCFLVHKQPIYMREFAFGTDRISQVLTGSIHVGQEQIHIGFKDAGSLIQQYHLLADVNTLDDTQPTRSALIARIRPLIEKLVSEFKRSLAYYHNTFSMADIRQVYLTGGGAWLEGMDTLLERELQIPVRRLNLIKDFSWKPKRQFELSTPSLVTTFGAALGLANAEEHNVNFADWQDRWHPTVVSINKALKAVIALSAVLGMIGWSTLVMQQTELTRETAKVELKLNETGPRTQQLEQLKNISSQIEGLKTKFSEIMGIKPLWGGIFRELSNLIPREILLEKLSLTEDKKPQELKMTGYVRAVTKPTDTLVADLLRSLNVSAFFTSASLLQRTQTLGEEEARNIFSVKTELRL